MACCWHVDFTIVHLGHDLLPDRRLILLAKIAASVSSAE
jgi:hypothetical protein